MTKIDQKNKSLATDHSIPKGSKISILLMRTFVQLILALIYNDNEIG